MKTNIKFTLAVIVLLTSCVILPRQTEAQQSNVSFQLFYDELSPYGEWVDYSNYGYVWIPDVGYDFLPYSTDGRWILTNYGWTWASNYNWGWAAFFIMVGGVTMILSVGFGFPIMNGVRLG